GTDPDEPGVDDGAGEVGVLGEEPVSGVDGVGAGALGRVEDRVDVEIGLGGCHPRQFDGNVGFADMGLVPICGGMDGHGGDAHLPAGAEDAAGDLAAVGHEDPGHHRFRDGTWDRSPVAQRGVGVVLLRQRVGQWDRWTPSRSRSPPADTAPWWTSPKKPRGSSRGRVTGCSRCSYPTPPPVWQSWRPVPAAITSCWPQSTTCCRRKRDDGCIGTGARVTVAITSCPPSSHRASPCRGSTGGSPSVPGSRWFWSTPTSTTPPGGCVSVSCRDSRSRHIRNTPKRSVPLTGPEWIADRAMPRTVLVSRGSMRPSSRTRPVDR